MRLHHIAVVVKDISKSIKTYENILGLDIAAKPGEDPVQKVNAAFLDLGWGDGITLELLEPTAQDSPVMKSLGRGGGLHHLCFEVDDIDEEIRKVKERGARVVCEPVPACGFDNRRIAFVFPVDNILVEFVEKEKS